MERDPHVAPMSETARALLDEARDRVRPPTGAKEAALARILGKLDGTIPHPAPDGPPHPHAPVEHAAAKAGALGAKSIGGIAAKFGATLVLGAALGSGATIAMRSAPAPEPTGIVQTATSSWSDATPAATLSAVPLPSSEPPPRQKPFTRAHPNLPAPFAGAAETSGTSDVRPARSDGASDSAGAGASGTRSVEAPRSASTARERTIVDEARAALARGDAATAIRAAEAHEREFPNGQLGAERDAILVRALVLANRRDEAAARAARFRAIYPNSVLLPVVENALTR